MLRISIKVRPRLILPLGAGATPIETMEHTKTWPLVDQDLPTIAENPSCDREPQPTADGSIGTHYRHNKVWLPW